MKKLRLGRPRLSHIAGKTVPRATGGLLIYRSNTAYVEGILILLCTHKVCMYVVVAHLSNRAISIFTSSASLAKTPYRRAISA